MAACRGQPAAIRCPCHCLWPTYVAAARVAREAQTLPHKQNVVKKHVSLSVYIYTYTIHTDSFMFTLQNYAGAEMLLRRLPGKVLGRCAVCLKRGWASAFNEPKELHTENATHDARKHRGRRTGSCGNLIKKPLVLNPPNDSTGSLLRRAPSKARGFLALNQIPSYGILESCVLSALGTWKATHRIPSPIPGACTWSR